MKFWYSVSFESDIQPVETVRGELEASDAEDAAKRGLFGPPRRASGSGGIAAW